VQLAKAGYAVTGVDISSGMLREARAEAGRAGVAVGLVRDVAATLALRRPPA
jgi:2-polyprenyl-3-methyl-5-hydroxy-6-metoxy-1,4-benzoquinol methylase